jgi:hypothetical protein
MAGTQRHREGLLLSPLPKTQAIRAAHAGPLVRRYNAATRRRLRPKLEALRRVEPQAAQCDDRSTPPFLALGDDAIHLANSIEVHASAVTQGHAAFARHVVAAAGTPKRIGTGPISTMPFQDHFAERETLRLCP